MHLRDRQLDRDPGKQTGGQAKEGIETGMKEINRGRRGVRACVCVVCVCVVCVCVCVVCVCVREREREREIVCV